MQDDFKYRKPSLLHPEGDPFQTAPGFSFNRNDFEDLIDNFTPFDDIPILLGVSHAQLDVFCDYIYNMKFKDTYDTLLRRSHLYYRKAMMSLSKTGNPSAIKVATEFYVGLGSLDKQDSHVTIINQMPQVESDAERLAKQQNAINKFYDLQDSNKGGSN